jgi:hypothetical protein
VNEIFDWFQSQLPRWDYPDVIAFLKALEFRAEKENSWEELISLISLLIDRRYQTANLRRSSLLTLFDQSLTRVIEIIKRNPIPEYTYHAFGKELPLPESDFQTIILDSRGYEPEGESSLAREIHRLADRGFKRYLIAHTRGHRFIGSGLGPDTEGIRIDVFGSPVIIWVLVWMDLNSRSTTTGRTN